MFMSFVTFHLKKPQILKYARCHHADVEISKADHRKTDPGPELVMFIQFGDSFPATVAPGAGAAVKRVQFAADEVAQGVASQRVTRQQNAIGHQDERSDADAELAAKPETI